MSFCISKCIKEILVGRILVIFPKKNHTHLNQFWGKTQKLYETFYGQKGGTHVSTWVQSPETGGLRSTIIWDQDVDLRKYRRSTRTNDIPPPTSRSFRFSTLQEFGRLVRHWSRNVNERLFANKFCKTSDSPLRVTHPYSSSRNVWHPSHVTSREKDREHWFCPRTPQTPSPDTWRRLHRAGGAHE